MSELIYKGASTPNRNSKGTKVLDEAGVPYVCTKCDETVGLYTHHKDGDISNDSRDNLERRCPSHHRKIHPTPFGQSICKRERILA